MIVVFPDHTHLLFLNARLMEEWSWVLLKNKFFSNYFDICICIFGYRCIFLKIHSGAVYIEKDKYLIPAHSLKSNRASHSAQYCRYQTYSDALMNSFFPNYSIVEWSFSFDGQFPDY